MSKTHAHILAEGVTECGWNQDTQKLLCLDYISAHLGSEGLVIYPALKGEACKSL